MELLLSHTVVIDYRRALATSPPVSVAHRIHCCSQPTPPQPPPLMDSLVGASSRSSSSPITGREDCWTEDATYTLIDAWGERHIRLNRGNLRQKHWQEVVNVVNAPHAHVNRTRRTDVQCKNRIDTLKKKYKIEKAIVSRSQGTYSSSWPFFYPLDALIGNNSLLKRHSLPVNRNRRSMPPAKSPSWFTSHVPVGPRSLTQKRPSLVPASMDDSYFRRNFSAFAAAAAAAEAEDADIDDSEDSRSSAAAGSRKRVGVGVREGERNRDSDRSSEFGYRKLAQAIERFAKIYESVEAEKQRQMVELEKQRMQFASDLEYQRMQLFMETQVQLQKIKRAKWSSRAEFLIATADGDPIRKNR